MKINRRKHPRIHEDIALNVTFADKFSLQSTIIDISMGGVKLHNNSGRVPQTAAPCRIVVEDLSVDVAFSVCGEVIWVDGDRMGIQFTEISRDARRILNGVIADLGRVAMAGHHAALVG